MSPLDLYKNDFLSLVWLGLPLLLASIFEALLWKTALFNRLSYPIHVGLFGVNKKWRGLVSLPLTHLVSVWIFQMLEIGLKFNLKNIILLSSFNGILYGLLIGFIFNLSELPNSFIKRRLKISPGDESNPVFYWIDHMDSPYGVLLTLYVYFRLPLHLILNGLWMTPLLFMGSTWLRKRLGVK
ncbi:MAG: CDP-archaeol synthase [Pseudanabaenales cyanobacterium]|nr:CDP-archaeol synthase [Pseudanabaenales cyanobacterium]